MPVKQKLTDKIPFRDAGQVLYDLDAAVLNQEARESVVRCISLQKEAAAESMATFQVAEQALEETSEARLAQILAGGEDVHGIATDRSISNVISFGASKVTDTVSDERINLARQEVDGFMKRLLPELFTAEQSFNVSSSGHFWYPAGSYMGWHTNSRVPGWRVYINYAEQPGKSWFRYREPGSGDIVTLVDDVWNLRIFRISSEIPVWHTVYSDTDRFSFGYMVHERKAGSRKSRWLKKLKHFAGR